ncbi:hypothetical protein, partial [Aeromonas sp. Y318-3]|uniref:hypothetical protein n=1 Tax=Aeromonas sp. Y318-3 TaxID=2990509 RepID=UPI0022E57E35
DGSNPSAAIVQSASDVQCSRLLKTTIETPIGLFKVVPNYWFNISGFNMIFERVLGGFYGVYLFGTVTRHQNTTFR